MRKNAIFSLPTNVLKENLERLKTCLSELEYCLNDLEEERDELTSTNEMLKITSFLLSNSKPDEGGLSPVNTEKISLSTEETLVSLTIEEEVQFRKRPSAPSVVPRHIKRKSIKPSLRKNYNYP